jgi:hypothetical protein
MCIDIRGILNWPKKNLKGLFIRSDGKACTSQEARELSHEIQEILDLS